jgi:hypothetical protein
MGHGRKGKKVSSGQTTGWRGYGPFEGTVAEKVPRSRGFNL